MTTLSRRALIEQLALAGLLLPAAALVACRDQTDKNADLAPKPDPTTKGATAPAPATGAEPVCDVAELDAAALGPRKALGYKEVSTDPAKSCEGCSLFIADIGGCPGCKLFKGPVAPKGTCNSWAPS